MFYVKKTKFIFTEKQKLIQNYIKVIILTRIWLSKNSNKETLYKYIYFIEKYIHLKYFTEKNKSVNIHKNKNSLIKYFFYNYVFEYSKKKKFGN